MRGNYYHLMVACCLALVITACHEEKEVIDQAEHRRLFFHSMPADTISDYRFVYRATRGGYITVAKVTTIANADSSFLQSFSQIASASSPAEERALANSMHLRASALMGGDMNVPIWFTNSTTPVSDYFVKKGTEGELQVWRSIPSRTLFLVAIGRIDSLHKKQ